MFLCLAALYESWSIPLSVILVVPLGILGAFLAAIGVIGDLVESLLKRSAGLKDSGCIFPGMGGILDVLDSLLFAAPALYFYLRWFGNVT